MARVSARIEVKGTVYESETFWYETRRWPDWVDQLARVVEVRGEWPRSGAIVIWESGPAGRGTVRERVTQYEPRVGQVSEVEDDSIVGRQEVAFEPVGEGVEVRLTLDYRLKRRTPVSALVDFLFIKRLMGASLAKTLSQFRVALEASEPRTFK